MKYGLERGKELNLTEYQSLALRTAVYPKPLDKRQGWVYPILGLQGEVGELSNKLSKVIRDKNNMIDEKTLLELKLEMGDIAWFYVVTCYELGMNPDEILKMNIVKLEERMKENKVKGDGDHR